MMINRHDLFTKKKQKQKKTTMPLKICTLKQKMFMNWISKDVWHLLHIILIRHFRNKPHAHETQTKAKKVGESPSIGNYSTTIKSS